MASKIFTVHVSGNSREELEAAALAAAADFFGPDYSLRIIDFAASEQAKPPGGVEGMSPAGKYKADVAVKGAHTDEASGGIGDIFR